LAKLHRISPKNIGVEDFGKPSRFYNRQNATLGMISDAQSKAVDVESHKPVGKIPHIDQVLSFFGTPRPSRKIEEA
jgi:hypothetical protein